MKFAIVFWTYNDDYNYLKNILLCFKYLRKHHDFDIYILDQHDKHFSMFDDKILNFIETEINEQKVFYKQTTFNRNGNLNGINCIKNMFLEYKNISNIKHYDWIIKCDSDTYLNHLNWIKKIFLQDNWGLIGSSCFSNRSYAIGSCYAIRIDVIDKMLNLLTDEFCLDFKRKRCPEDFQICQFIKRLNYKLKIYRFSLNSNDKCYGLYSFAAAKSKKRDTDFVQKHREYIGLIFKDYTRADFNTHRDNSEDIVRYYNWINNENT